MVLIFLEIEYPRVSPLEIKANWRSSATFQCSHTKSIVTWTFENGPLPHNAHVDITKSSRLNTFYLTIHNVDETNVGSYTCTYINKQYQITFYEVARLELSTKYRTLFSSNEVTMDMITGT